MEGTKIINDCIGKTLQTGKIQSFFLKDDLINKINVTFLKFDKWIRIISSDDVTTVATEEDCIEKTNFYGDETFRYPNQNIELAFKEFEKYIDKRLLNWKELVHLENHKYSLGLNLYFESDLNLIIYNEPKLDVNRFIFENKIPISLIEI